MRGTMHGFSPVQDLDSFPGNAISPGNNARLGCRKVRLLVGLVIRLRFVDIHLHRTAMVVEVVAVEGGRVLDSYVEGSWRTGVRYNEAGNGVVVVGIKRIVADN